MRFLVEGGDAFFDDLDGITEIPRIRGCVEHADVGAVTDEPEGVHAALAQRDIEIGAEKSGVPSLRDDDIALERRELGHDLRTLRPGERMRREHLELGIAGQMVVGEVDDRLRRGTRSRDLLLDDRDDPRHGRTAVESAALVHEVFDHVDDDERSFHQWPDAGSHSSMRWPSGSVIHPKRPFSSS